MLGMEYIDTHSHLFLEDFSSDLPAVVERAKLAGITKIFMPNIDSASIPDLLRVSAAYPDYCFPMMGLHPTSVKEDYKKELSIMKKMLDTEGHPFVAIGEVGLDLYWDKTYEKEQLDTFTQQIDWSLFYNLPLIIHSREAFELLYRVMSQYKSEPVRGIFHSFSGTEEEALKLLELPGFYLGINGVVTFKKSTLPQVLKSVPLERLVLETDSPYLSPVPKRGKRNESSHLQYTLRKIGDRYEVSSEKVADITTRNAFNVFGVC